MNSRRWIWSNWHLFWFSSLAIGFALNSEIQTQAQTIPDATLGNENSIITPNVTINKVDSDRIDGGAIRGANLFHSFSEFNVDLGRGVYFSTPTGIETIFTRVTGGNASQILGTLGVLGNADLFLMNPNGIIFGSNARLDVTGSFIGSTASLIKFADGTEFSATNPDASPLLTIAVPIGLQYGANPGTIVNQSIEPIAFPEDPEAIDEIESLTESSSLNEGEFSNETDPLTESGPLPVGLQVQPGRTLALVGGDVILEGGFVTAPQGRIEMGSVGDRSFVSLTPTDFGWALNYQGVQNFQDISLSQNAIVDASGEGGGEIQVVGRRITLTGDSQILSKTQGSQAGRNLTVTASQSIDLSGDFSSFSTQTSGTGTGGDLTIATGRLTLQAGGFIETPTIGEGQGGNLIVRASESVEAIGKSSDGEFPSGLFAQVSGAGNGGNMLVETKRAIVRDGALIDATTFGSGRAGDVRIRASEFVQLIGTDPDPRFAGGISADVGVGATGDGGNVTIETSYLSVRGGGQIATASKGEGQGGILTIAATDAIEVSGTAPVMGDTLPASSGLFVSAEEGSTGNGGELQITTQRMSVREGARISANTLGPGRSGNITLNVRELIVENGGTIGAGSFAEGTGGTLRIDASESVKVSGTGTVGTESLHSTLFTQAQGSGNAGSLSITTDELTVTDDAHITVGSIGSGNAGTLDIQARDIRIDNAGKLIADNTAGLGNINIQTRELTLQRNSLITTTSRGEEPGGNITIDTDNLVALNNSDIRANAVNSSGGRAIVNARGIFGTDFRAGVLDTPASDITATSELGAEFNGTVEVNTPDANPSSGLVQLPETVVDPEGLVTRDLCTPEQLAGSSFSLTGRGGLPPSPSDALIHETLAVEWAEVARDRTGVRNLPNVRHSPSANRQHKSLQEAQGWIVAADGTIVLTAEPPTVTPHDPKFTDSGCSSFADRAS